MVTTRAPKTSEAGWPPSLWPALSALIGESWPPVSDAAVAAFVRGAETHRLLAIAADDGSLPAAVRSRVRERLGELSPARALVERDTDDLIARLPTLMAGAEWLGTNGVDLRLRLYPSPHLRPMNDVDLVARPAHAAAIVRQLLAQGLTAKPELPGARDIGLEMPARDGRPWSVWLDIYPGLVDPSRADIDYDEIFGARELGPDGLPRMAARHALAAHALLLANMQLVTHLRKVLDLWLFSRDTEAVQGAIDCARRWNIRRSLYIAFSAMRRVFPESAVDLGDLLASRERTSLDRIVAQGAPFPAFPPRPVQIWRKLSLLDSPGIRVRFAVAYARQMARR